MFLSERENERPLSPPSANSYYFFSTPRSSSVSLLPLPPFFHFPRLSRPPSFPPTRLSPSSSPFPFPPSLSHPPSASLTLADVRTQKRGKRAPAKYSPLLPYKLAFFRNTKRAPANTSPLLQAERDFPPPNIKKTNITFTPYSCCSLQYPILGHTTQNAKTFRKFLLCILSSK